MLQSMREASKSLVMKIILTLIALTFVIFFGNSFIGSSRNSGGASSVVEVGDVSFNSFDIRKAFGDTIRQAQANPAFAGLTQEQAIKLGLLDRTISQLVTRTLFDLGARDLGVVATDAEASSLVRQVSQFQNAAGRFDRNKFETYLRSAGISEQQYINQLRGDLVRSQLVGALNAGIKTPDDLVNRFYRYNGERRVAEIAVIKDDAVPSVGKPDDTQLSTFYDKNKKRFETPEYRSGVLVSLTIDDFAREIGISDADIAAYYKDNQARYIEPATRHVVSALFSSKEDAEKAAARIRGGEDFAKVVKEVTGSDPADLGSVTRAGTLVDEIGAAAFALKKPGLAGPFKSPFGWNLAMVSDIKPRGEKSLDEVRDTIKHTLQLQRARDQIYDVLAAFEDSLAGGATLEEAAKNNGLKATPIGPLANDGTAPDENKPRYADQQVLSTLFSTDSGQQSSVVERKDGGFFALRVDKVDAPHVPPLADIRDKVVAAWTGEQQAAAAERIAGEIADHAGGSSLVAAAAKAGFTATKTKPFDRRGKGADVPPEAVDMIFDAKAGEIVHGAISDGAVVAQLTEIVAPPADSPDKKRLRSALAQSIANDIQIEFANALRTQHKVDIDSKELQRLYPRQ